MKKPSIYLLIIPLLCSCAVHTGMMTGNANLNSKSEIVNIASGEAKAVYILGIGGLDSKSLVKDAKDNLYINYPILKGQAYANITVDSHFAYYFLAAVHTITVTADIVNLDSDIVTNEVQSIFKGGLVQATIGAFSVTEKLGYYINEQVIEVTIIDYNEFNRYSLEDTSGVLYSDVKRKEIIQMNGGLITSNGAYRVGDVVKFNAGTEAMYKTLEQKNGTIIGIGGSKLFIKSEGKFYRASIEDIIGILKE
ncbi:MAG: hypothetical protein MK086_08265 [Flavobacteriales bacterium]|nr:hypothetical protein [Flavobacteriales bacterium]